MTFIYILLFFFLLIIFIVLGVVGSIARFLFGKPRTNDSAQHQQQQKKTSNKWYTYGKKRKKIFTENDGEYVEFEEIKPDKK